MTQREISANFASSFLVCIKYSSEIIHNYTLYCVTIELDRKRFDEHSSKV